MPNPPTVSTLQNQLKRRGVRLNTLHALLRLAELEGARRRTEREQRICKFVAMLGGVREPDLVAISGLSQPTLWRLLAGLRGAGTLRVVTSYNDRAPGRRATWLQPPGSPDLDDDRRAALVETAALIRAYVPLWQAERARVRLLERNPGRQVPADPLVGDWWEGQQTTPHHAHTNSSERPSAEGSDQLVEEHPKARNGTSASGGRLVDGVRGGTGGQRANADPPELLPGGTSVPDDGARAALASSGDGVRRQLSPELAILEARPAPETPVSRVPLPAQPRPSIGPPFELPEDAATSPAFPWSFALKLLAAAVIVAVVIVLVLHVG